MNCLLIDNKAVSDALNDVVRVWWKKYKDMDAEALKSHFSEAFDEAGQLMQKHNNHIARCLIIHLLDELEARVVGNSWWK